MPTWTADQAAAIQSCGENLLLSAAAGSGKTTVLVARALALIESGVDVDRLLIVTFSRAAAADMKSKLADALTARAEDNARLMEQIDRLERASVCTLHSFCIDVLHAHFEAAGVDPAFRVLDDAELKQLEARALEQALEQAYAQGDAGLMALDYGRGPRRVGELALETLHFSRQRSDPEAWLDWACLDLPQGDGEIWAQELTRAVRRSLCEARALCEVALALTDDPEGPLPYAAALREDVLQLDDLLAAPDYRSLCAQLADTRSARLKSYRPQSERAGALAEQVKTLREAAKKLIKGQHARLLPLDDQLNDLRAAQGALRALRSLTGALSDILDEMKAERSALSFDDLEHRALRALRDPRAAAGMRARYDHVFVDEYQDVSDVQEALLRIVRRADNLFMVGDVKQSIYRFRQAEPALFLEKYADYGAGRGGRLIALRQNFRSRASILEFTNAVFERIMTGGDAEVLYDDAARLRPGAAYQGEDSPIELHLVVRNGLEDEETDDVQEDESREWLRAEQEASLAVSRIAALMGQDTYDARAGQTRPLRPRDFAVLVRTRAGMGAVEQLLNVSGIPAYADAAGGFFDALEVRLALALFRLIENHRRDVDLLACLRAPIVGLESVDLARIRAAYPSGSFRDAALQYMDEKQDMLAARLRDFEQALDRWRTLSRVLPLDRFVDSVLRESGHYAYVGGMPAGARRQANLDALCARAADFESAQAGALTGFLSYVNEVTQSGNDLGEARTLSEADDVVRVMTVHKSKGLEFPVVVALQMGRALARSGARSELFAHRTLGLGIRHTDRDLGSVRDTLPRRAIAERAKREDFNEEMRVLYVLLTRAMDRLILIGTVKDQENAFLRFRTAAMAAGMQPASWLEAMAPAVLSLPGGGDLVGQPDAPDANGPRVRVSWYGAAVPPAALSAADNGESPAEVLSCDNGALEQALYWRYPYAEEVLMPLKLSVSSLAREEIGPASLPPLARRPSFLSEEATGAEYGTQMHAALRGLNLESLRSLSAADMPHAVAGQLDDMRARGLLQGTVSAGAIVRFLCSETGARLLASERIEREWAFTLRLDGQELLLQGVIDCCFIEAGKWVLLDYKTDRADNPDALADRYRPQVALYARALAEITGIPVAERQLYLLGANICIAL